MISDFNYWSKVIKRIISVLATLIIIMGIMKLSIFYIPFLIAFVLALMIEPIIKILMKKVKISRRLSSILVIAFFIILFLGLAIWGITTLFTEANNLLNVSDDYYEKAKNLINSISNNEKILEILPEELRNGLQNSEADIIHSITNMITNILGKIKDWIIKLPNLFMLFFFTLVSLYFMCTDKIYMIDQLEHHLPDRWSKKFTIHLHEITKALGSYIKAEAILILISFLISLIGFTLFKVFRFKSRISTSFSYWNCLCRCTSNLRIRKCNDSMGNY